VVLGQGCSQFCETKLRLFWGFWIWKTLIFGDVVIEAVEAKVQPNILEWKPLLKYMYAADDVSSMSAY
jgi:hypothetical protein